MFGLTRRRNFMRIKFILLMLALVGAIDLAAAFTAQAAGKVPRLPGMGHMDGTTGGGRRGGGGTKTGDYNDSNDANAAAGADHDSLANDPNANLNQGVKDPAAGA